MFINRDYSRTEEDDYKLNVEPRLTRINWVDADLHERTKTVPCKRCGGKRQIEIAICAQVKD